MDERDYKLDSQQAGAPRSAPGEPLCGGAEIPPSRRDWIPADGPGRRDFSDAFVGFESPEEEDGLTACDFDSRYIWDEYNKVLYETLPERERKGFGFGQWLALAVCALALALSVGGWLHGGRHLLPANSRGQSILAAEQAQEEQRAAPSEQELESGGAGAGAEPYVATAILVNGDAEGALASQEAAYALVEEVKAHFEALAREKGEGELVVELVEEVSFRPATASEKVESYETLFARFTGDQAPLKVKCTLIAKESREIGFDISQEEDPYLLAGNRIVVSGGRPGEKVTISHTVYINGDRSTTRSGTETQIVKAQDRVVRIGTQAIDPEAEPGGREGKKGPDTNLSFQSPMADFEVVSNYGQRRGVLHLGLDYAPREGGSRDVLASCAGTVAAVMKRGGYGLLVEIDHGEGFTTRYAHLESASVALGDRVSAGQAIGRAGQSGNAETIHLHFELRIQGEAYNPRYYLD